jgi:exodeoxyribonuclease VII large subunit
MQSPQSVSSLNLQIKSLLESTFISVYVEGEISNLTYHSSGHVYFSLKDESSTISCVMFRGNATKLKFRLEYGMKVVISGGITAYTPRGSYQIICSNIKPSGAGELSLAYEQLKKRLSQKGYFESSHKKPLPKFPSHIALVTSPTGAVIQDMKKIAKARFPLCRFTLIPTIVQGDNSKEDIASSIKYADTLKADIIIVGRGGGSLEDLWGFNEEKVADAIYEANTPIISAVGHESDVCISDFVADIRASTPSNAIELALPDKNELLIYLDNLSSNFNSKFNHIISSKEFLVNSIKDNFEQNSILGKFKIKTEQINLLKQNFHQLFLNRLSTHQNNILMLKSSFENSKQSKALKSGFAKIYRQNKSIDLDILNVDDEIELQNNSTIIKAIVKDKKQIV